MRLLHTYKVVNTVDHKESYVDYTPYIRDIADWPKEGVVFKDITPLIAHPEAYRQSIMEMIAPYRESGITKVIGAEARGFLFGSVIAYELGAGFVPARKPGKLPGETISAAYELEYGIDSLEVHSDAITADDTVLIVDDVLATGGTAKAKAELVLSTGAKIAGYAFFIELDFLHGREKLDASIPIVSLVHVS